jgi:transcription elongation factor Elf1
MKFICPRCGGDAFHLHKLPDNDSMAQCIACGKAIVFEQAAATASGLTANAVTDTVEPAAAVTANAAGPEASGQSDGAKRGKLHLPNRM